MLLAALGLGLVVLASGVTLYVTGRLPARQRTEPAEPTDQGRDTREAIYVELSPAFTVNFHGTHGARFLQISVEAMTREPKVRELLKQHMPMIRNQLVLLFSSQSAEELATREGKEKLLQDTLTTIQKVLERETGTGGVEAVFFTSFVMQ